MKDDDGWVRLPPGRMSRAAGYSHFRWINADKPPYIQWRVTVVPLERILDGTDEDFAREEGWIDD